MSPTRAVHAELVDLSHELRATAHFAILGGPEVLYIEKEDPPGRGIRVASAVGKAALVGAPIGDVPGSLADAGNWRFAIDGPEASPRLLDQIPLPAGDCSVSRSCP